jgi:phage repressor protein C with HTH and peptisase S24 domain
MTLLGDRLKAAMGRARIEQAELAAKVGCTQGAISQILTGRTSRSRFLPDIAEALGTTTAFLLGDTNDPAPRASSELTEGEMADRLDLVSIASVDMAYGMGLTFASDPVHVDVLHFPRRWLESLTSTAPQELAWARGRGNSMSPTIEDNDLVLIDRSDRSVRDQDAIWAFTIGEVAMMKRLRIRGEQVTILSDNAHVPPDHAHPEEIHIVGRVSHIVRRL